MIRDLLMDLLAICLSSLEKGIQILCPFLNCVVFLLLGCGSFVPHPVQKRKHTFVRR